MKYTLLLFLLAFSYSGKACLNFYVTDSSGHVHLHEENPPTEILKLTEENLHYQIERLKNLAAEIKTTDKALRYKPISDYSAILIKLGCYKEALLLLEKEIVHHPDEYNLNANIAVAYELNGDLPKALAYQKKAIKLNPNSHNNSEWIHLNILESAIALKNNNPFATDILKAQQIHGQRTQYHISYQLQERVPLTPAPNNFMGRLLEQSGDYYNANVSMEWAIELYAMAIAYYGPAEVKNNLWGKIERTHARLVQINRKKKKEVAKYLYSNFWKNEINRQIAQWQQYKPYTYTGEIITNFD